MGDTPALSVTTNSHKAVIHPVVDGSVRTQNPETVTVSYYMSDRISGKPDSNFQYSRFFNGESWSGHSKIVPAIDQRSAGRERHLHIGAAQRVVTLKSRRHHQCRSLEN